MTEDPDSRRPPSLELDGSSEPEARPPRLAARAARLGPPHVPLWGRWVVSLSVAAVAIVALVLFVNAHGNDKPIADNTRQTAENNREAAALVAEDQTPRVSALKPGTPDARAIESAVAAFMRRMINGGTFEGPLTRTRCRATGSEGHSRQAFACDAVAASVRYPFLGIVDARAKRVTYCRDDPAGPNGTVPVSPRCRA
jgi:hypothetical protein